MKLLRLRPRRPLPKKPPRRPEVEQLEDRAVPASLSYSSFLPSAVYGTAVDSAGNVYLAGGSWVAKVDATGSTLDYMVSVGDNCTSIAVDAAGDAYVTGTGLAVPTTPNAIASSGRSFIAELGSTGSILYATDLPGALFGYSGVTYGDPGAIAVDGSGNIYVAGGALAGLPVTAGAYQTAYRGGGTFSNAFFAKINPSLSGSASLVYASYLGGSGSVGDAATGIALDASGNAYVTGYTDSTDFPTSAGAFHRTFGGGEFDAFVAKFNPSLSGPASLVYSTYLGGSGSDGYVSDNPSVIDNNQIDGGIAVDSAGNAYVTSATTSTNFPTTRGAYQATSGMKSKSGGARPSDVFVTKLNATGTGLLYSTYLGSGGTTESGGASIAVDASGDAELTGWTNSTTFPTQNPLQADNGGSFDAFVTAFNPSGSGLLFSSYFGGSGTDYGYGIALDSAGNAYVGGNTSSPNFPTTAGAYQTTYQSNPNGDGFVLKIDPPADAPTASPAAAQAPSGGTSPVDGNGSPASLGTPDTALPVPALDADSLGLAWWLTPAPLPSAPSAGPTESLAPSDHSSTPAPTAGRLTQPGPVDLVASAHAPAAVDALFADLGSGLPLGDPVSGPSQA